MIYSVEKEIAGRKLKIETGLMAKQANGAVTVQYADTLVLVTAVAAGEPKEGIDFFPLTVDLREKAYASGKIPGGFIKREGRPSDEAVLSSRLIDRPIRPLFPDGFYNETFIVPTLLSVDGNNTPNVPALIGASAALTISNIPFAGPVAGVRMGRINGEFVINMLESDSEKSDLDMFIAGTKDAIIMIEAGADEVDESVVIEAIAVAHNVIREICELQEELAAKCGKEKMQFNPELPNEKFYGEIEGKFGNTLTEAILTKDKKMREHNCSEVKARVLEHYEQTLGEEYAENKKDIVFCFDLLERTIVRRMISREGKRADGRGLKDIRDISIHLDLIPRAHGSALFTRGQTQSLGVVTLGNARDEQIVEIFGEERRDNFMLHYNFPPFSVGEARPMRAPGRREIGHGNLAQRALQPIIQNNEKFPYTVRVVSEILESNGSSSMASVCSGSLSLMAAGVPMKKPVAGIAMGLIQEEGKISILSDIMGMEDHLGDMDFKVAGTKDGITALQMDIKIDGVNEELLKTALSQAKEGRMHILGKMAEVITETRNDLSPFAPRIVTVKIDVDKIGAVIGSSGKVIKEITERTSADIVISDDGNVTVMAPDAEKCAKAVRIIKLIAEDPIPGDIITGKVVRIMPFGAFVEIAPGKDGLVHISQLDTKRVERVEDVVNLGDEVEAVVAEIDSRGRINLSRKKLLIEKEKEQEN